MPTFSQKLDAAQSPKVDNNPQAERAKVTIRRNVMTALGEPARVFDAFAGEGGMYRQVWREAAHYVGCDMRFVRDERLAFVADNRRVLRAIDLTAFNVFDFDAYGSPWEQLYIVAARRPLRGGETVGVVITDGQGLQMKMGSVSTAFSLLAGVAPKMPGMNQAQDEVMSRAIGRLATMMRATVAQRWQAIGRKGTSMYYVGLVLRAD